MGLHIVVTGNPVDGFNYIGPFKTADDAIEWADAKSDLEGDWWIAALEAQSEHEGEAE